MISLGTAKNLGVLETSQLMGFLRKSQALPYFGKLFQVLQNIETGIFFDYSKERLEHFSLSCKFELFRFWGFK